MRYNTYENYTKITAISDFNLKKTFECGQCFRWNVDENGVYTGVAFGKAAKIWTEGTSICISGREDDFLSYWRDYFDLDRDYSAIRESLCVDNYMRKATTFGAGIRILRQNKWEALCSFIISQCNNIPRIKGIVEALCREFGEPIEFDGKIYYSFPGSDTIAKLTPEQLAPIRSGFRASYIVGAAKAIEEGYLDMDALAEGSYESALKALKKLKGVGDKVANCVILFGLNMLNAFPVDVWMKRTISEHYDKSFTPDVFGEYAGIAQQYMFYYARSGQEEIGA